MPFIDYNCEYFKIKTSSNMVHDLIPIKLLCQCLKSTKIKHN